MKHIQKSVMALLMIGVGANFLMGCGKVEFSEAEPESQSAMSGDFYSESFTQGVTSTKLDVLFVVDNSGSMAEEQEKLGQRISSFINTLQGVDWRIGVTTTDVSDGAFGLKGRLLEFSPGVKWIGPSTKNKEELFLNTVVRPESSSCNPECPSGDEQPLKAMTLAFEKHSTENLGFFRDGADIGIIVLSDEDEMSSGGSNATKPAEVVAKADSIWGEEKRIFTYGMVVKPGDTSCYNAQSGQAKYGTFVAELARITNGMVGSICETDYAPTLGLIAEHAKKLLDYIKLRYIPVVETLEVSFLPEHITDFRVDGKRVYFTNPPANGTKISVGYIVK
jgi:hypothetical protein